MGSCWTAGRPPGQFEPFRRGIHIKIESEETFSPHWIITHSSQETAGNPTSGVNKPANGAQTPNMATSGKPGRFITVAFPQR